MSDTTVSSIVVDATPDRVMDVLCDLEDYPSWNETRSARVLQRGDGGRPSLAEFEVAVPMLGHATFTLAYRYAPGDAGMSWVSTAAQGAVSRVSGEYLLGDLGDGRTEVTYRLRVELTVLLPGFVRTRGEERLIANALDGLRTRVESVSH